MSNHGCWTAEQVSSLHEGIRDGVCLADLAARIGKTERAVSLYCFRHYVPLRRRLDHPMMVRLLEVKFVHPEYFHATRSFLQTVRIGQRRWQSLYWGYEQPTEEEIRRVALALNFNVEEALKLLDARQMNLFVKP